MAPQRYHPGAGASLQPDFLVVGAGIVGLTCALALKRRYTDATIRIIDKEPDLAAHSSGRNSGVLHAGFYYGAGSMKARLCADGNRRWQAWCDEHGLPVRRCGKLVVARDADEERRLDELLRRAEHNGVDLKPVTAAEAREIEPRVRTHERALFASATASVDPRQVVRSVAEVARAEGIEVVLGCAYRGREADGRLRVGDDLVQPGFVLNTAGLHADTVARDFGFSSGYRILPFKGLYLVGDERAGPLRCHIYPVPDLKMPFLGVHFTVTVDDHVKIGPTALPALGREHYGGLRGIGPVELVDILMREASMALTHSTFRQLAFQELGKAFRRRLVRLATHMLDGVEPEHYTRWGRPGIRAQLLDLEKRELVMDFLVEGDETSLHVLNAVSPAFTCALPLADLIVDDVAARVG